MTTARRGVLGIRIEKCIMDRNGIFQPIAVYGNISTGFMRKNLSYRMREHVYWIKHFLKEVNVKEDGEITIILDGGFNFIFKKSGKEYILL